MPTLEYRLRRAKKLYRDALAGLANKSGSSVSEVWVNYGNCLSGFGRYIEAIECYQKALAADSTNGMAAGNLGIELERAAQIAGHYRHEYMALAHDALSRALGPEMHLHSGSLAASQRFQSVLVHS